MSKKIDFIDLAAQQTRIKKNILDRIDRVLTHGQYIQGPEIKELEAKLASFVGVKHALLCSSGTDALLLAMMALDIKAGDEVITTPFTFFATGEMIALIGAKPVFVDINAETYNLDFKLVEKALSPRTRAIAPVNLYGQCADFDELLKLASAHKIPLIEDAAQSFGASYKAKRSCSFGAIACTSFFPAKPLGCYGDGGAVFTNDDAHAKALSQFLNHGQESRYYHTRIGINGRFDTLQAAIMLSKLEIFEDELRAREKIANRYTKLIHDACGNKVKTPKIAPHNFSPFAQYTIEVENRSSVVARLQEFKVPTSVHYPTPLHLQPAFAYLKYPKGSFPVAERASERVLSLPMHPYLSENDQDYIVESLAKAL